LPGGKGRDSTPGGRDDEKKERSNQGVSRERSRLMLNDLGKVEGGAWQRVVWFHSGTFGRNSAWRHSLWSGLFCCAEKTAPRKHGALLLLLRCSLRGLAPRTAAASRYTPATNKETIEM
jgi:hypothetical protein